MGEAKVGQGSVYIIFFGLDYLSLLLVKGVGLLFLLRHLSPCFSHDL